MQIASQKYDPFYFNWSGNHSYKSELKKLKDIGKDRNDEFNKYFSLFEVLELDHKEITDELNSQLIYYAQKT